MFWLSVAKRTDKIVFDRRIAVHYDSGAIAAADGLFSQLELRRQIWYLQHFHNVRTKFALTEEQRAIVEQACDAHGRGFLWSALGLIRDGEVPDFRAVRDFLAWQPNVLRLMISVLSGHLRKRMAGATS